MKEGITASFGTVVISFITYAFGGFDAGLIALVSFILVDYVLGFIVAAVFRKSKKSKNGGRESAAGYKGLIKKGLYLLTVYIAVQLDIVIGSDFIRNAVVIAFISNELISIIENMGIMGVPIPAVILRAIDVLNKKGNGDDK